MPPAGREGLHDAHCGRPPNSDAVIGCWRVNDTIIGAAVIPARRLQCHHFDKRAPSRERPTLLLRSNMRDSARGVSFGDHSWWAGLRSQEVDESADLGREIFPVGIARVQWESECQSMILAERHREEPSASRSLETGFPRPRRRCQWRRSAATKTLAGRGDLAFCKAAAPTC